LPEEDPLSLQMRHFVDVARGEAEPVLNGREGSRTLKATLTVKRAARVSLPDGGRESGL
jgi:hypothetical protein